MHEFMEGWKDGSEITVDPNDVVMNAAGTNMTVATYPEKELNRGNKKPTFAGFRTLNVSPENLKKLEGIFLIEAAKIKGRVKITKVSLRSERQKRVVGQISVN